MYLEKVVLAVDSQHPVRTLYPGNTEREKHLPFHFSAGNPRILTCMCQLICSNTLSGQTTSTPRRHCPHHTRYSGKGQRNATNLLHGDRGTEVDGELLARGNLLNTTQRPDGFYQTRNIRQLSDAEPSPEAAVPPSLSGFYVVC